MRCTVLRHKLAYPTVADAMRALEEGKRTWRIPPRRWYLCEHCGHYHITSRPAGDPSAARLQTLRDRAEYRAGRNPFTQLDKLLPEEDT